MTPCALIRETALLFRNAGIPDPENDSALLLSFLCGKSSLSLRLDTDMRLDESLLREYKILAERRLTREPLQYITCKAPFYKRTFFVDSRVLIPRPETELLCLWALELFPHNPVSVLDLCCGSGCIGLTLGAERPSWKITLSDISQSALEVARINCSALSLSAAFHHGDLTEGLPDHSFDLIISNPPYIPSSECIQLQKEVLYEPHEALDGGTDGMEFYRRIASEALRVARTHGILMMELGFGEAVTVRRILSESGYNDIRVRQDLNGIDRMITAVIPDGGKTCWTN